MLADAKRNYPVKASSMNSQVEIATRESKVYETIATEGTYVSNEEKSLYVS